jgi:hypothetical protein
MWIGVDLDGTLAFYEQGQLGIGAPIEPMVVRVLHWIAKGYEVRIFTTRAEDPRQKLLVSDWLERNGMGGLMVTNVKDEGMLEMWDDRAVQVERNTGRVMNSSTPLTRQRGNQISKQFTPFARPRKW